MKATDIKKTAVIGSKVIGSSMATAFAMNGYPVSVLARTEKSLKEAEEFVIKNLKYMQEKEILTAEEVEKALGQVVFTSDYDEALSDVQFISEAGPENYDAKKTILQEAEKYIADDTIFASCTSGLMMSEIATVAKHPERCMAAHPYNPPHLIPLIEIAKAEKTSDEAIQCCYDFLKMIGKEPIILNREVKGFISNRLQMALYRELIHLVMSGACSVEDVDKALVFGPGLRWALMGCCMCFEMSGGNEGIEGLLHKMEPGWAVWLKDMADWKDFPEEWPEIAQAGVNEEMANRDPETGNDHDSIIRWRDDRLLEILRMHNLL